MTQWASSKAARVYRALLRIGWAPTGPHRGSHVQLKHPEYPGPYTWAFHDAEEIGPVMLARIAKKTGLKPDDI